MDRRLPPMGERNLTTVTSESDPHEHHVRLTEQDALQDLRTMLELTAAGEVKCSATTSRPSAATVRVIAEHLAHGDFYPDEAIAAFA